MGKLSYLNHIDALRAIAVTIVVLFHLDIAFFKGGFIGVDVFFVISGFLITRIISHEYKETNTFSFKNFYFKRIRRLLPSLFLTILLTFGFGFLILSPTDFTNAVKSMLAASTATSNFFFLSQTGYFDTASSFKPLLHTWSLGIEEQFYILWPATIFFLLKSFSEKKIKAIVLIVFIGSFILTVFTTKSIVPHWLTNILISNNDIVSNFSSFHFFLLPFRIFEFTLGALLVFLPNTTIKNDLLNGALNLIGLSLIIYSATKFDKSITYLSSLNILPCIGVAMLIYFKPSNYLLFIFNNPALKLLGNISYTFYLLHWPIIVFYKYLINPHLKLMEQTILFLVSFLLSLLVYKLYETPLRYTDHKLSIKSNKKLIITVLSFISVIFIVKTNIARNDGWLWRLEQKNIDLINKLGNPKNFHRSNWGGANYPYQGWVGNKKPNKGESADIIIFGDSHSGHYSYGLDNVMVQKNNKIVHTTNFNAILLPEIKPTHTQFEQVKNIIQNEIKIIKNNPKATLILSQSWIGKLKRSQFKDKSSGKYEDLTNDTIGYKILAEKIELLHKAIGLDRKIIVMGCSPTNLGDNLNYIEQLLRPKYVSNFVENSSSFKIKEDIYIFNDFMKNYFNENQKITVIDPSELFCKNLYCIAQEGDKIYFSDAGHFSKQGSLLIVNHLEPELLKIIN